MSSKKPIVRYLEHGVWKNATVVDIGDLDKLKTLVKTDLVSAINSIQAGGGSTNPDLEQIIKDLQDGLINLEGILDGIQTGGLNPSQKQELENKLSEIRIEIETINSDIAAEIERIKDDYNARIKEVETGVADAKGSIAETVLNLEGLRTELSEIDLNILTITQEIDTVKGEILQKVDKTEFELTEAEVKRQATAIQQNAEAISMTATKEDLNLATDRISKTEADLKIQADEISSKVTHEEMREEIENAEKYPPNLLRNTRDWIDWINEDTQSIKILSDTYRLCHIQEISANNKGLSTTVNELEIGKTYTASVYVDANIGAELWMKAGTESYQMTTSDNETVMTGEWQRFRYSFVATEETITIQFFFRSLVGKGLLSGSKLELGSKTTGWQAHTDDIYERTIKNESKIQQNADKIVQTVETVEQQGENIKSNKTLIDQQADKIGLVVESVEEIDGIAKGNKASIEILEDEIVSKVTKTEVGDMIGDINVDNRNHIINSDFRDGVEKWTVAKGFNLVGVGEDKMLHARRTGLTNDLSLTAVSNSFAIGKDSRIMFGFSFLADTELYPDRDVVASLEVLDIRDVRIDFKEVSLSGKYVNNGKVQRINDVYISKNENAVKARLVFSLKRNGSIYFGKAMAQMGDIKSTDWSSAPEDALKKFVQMETEIKQTQEEILLKASKTEIEELSGKIDYNTSQIELVPEKIALSVTEVKGYADGAAEGAVATAKSYTDGKIELTDKSIELAVTEVKGYTDTSVQGVEQSVKEYADAQIKLTSDSITSTVTGVKQTADSTKDKVDKIEKEYQNQFVAILSNDSAMIPTDKDGLNGVYDTATSTFDVYKLGVNDSINWTLKTTPSNGVTGNLIGRTYTVTNMTTDTGSVIFSATKGSFTVSKTFVLTKAKQGSVGEKGDNSVVGLLTNESITLPANKDGLVSSFVGATGIFDVYDGITKKTGLGVTYSVVTQSNITVSINATTGAYSVTAMPTGTTILNGYAVLRAVYNGVTIEKQINVSKSIAGTTGSTGATGDPGASATSYWITASNNIIGKSQTGVINPTTITFKGFSKTGTANSVAYSGRFIIQTSTNGTTYETRYTSSADQNTYTYTIPTDSLFVKCLFYMAGGTSVLLDEQTVPVVESAEGISTSVRNLVTSTSTLDDMGDSQKANGVRLEEDRHMGNLSIKRTFVSGNADAYHQQTSVPMTGKEYVVTFWAKADRPLTFWNYLYNPDTITSSANSDGYKSTTVNGSSGLQATTEWKKYWIKWTQNSSPSKKYLLLGRLTSAGTIWINSPMLVEGNVPVDWQPAPEDARTYKAWANSSDGTADFTRVYPNENLIIDTNFDGESWSSYGSAPISYPVEDGTKNIKVVKTATSQQGIRTANTLDLEKGVPYTLSYQARGTLTTSTNYVMLSPSPNYQFSSQTRALSTTFKQFTQTFTVPTSLTGVSVDILFTDTSGTSGQWLEIKGGTLKLERGTTPTVYTTNTADSLTGSMPKYVGFSPLDSDDPKDYTWILNPDYAENSSKEYSESKIKQTSTDIMMSVTESFVGSEEFGTYIESVGTQFQQTADDFNFIFDDVKKSINGVAENVEKNYSEIQKYIRFEDGNIILGSSDSDSTLKITQNEIAFMQGGSKVAYFSGQSFYINKGILVESMQVGEHRMTRGSGGHTSFDWTG